MNEKLHINSELVAALKLVAAQPTVTPGDLGITTISEFKARWDDFDNMNNAIYYARKILERMQLSECEQLTEATRDPDFN